MCTYAQKSGRENLTTTNYFKCGHSTTKLCLNTFKIKRGVIQALILTAISSQCFSAWHSCSQNLSVGSDLISFTATVQNGVLEANAYARQPFSSLDFATHRKVDFFIDADRNSNTGDARPGAIRGTDFRISCIADFPTCTMYRLPTNPYGGETKISNTVQATLLNGNRWLKIRVPTNYSTLDIFAMAHGGTRFNSSGTGNGDRCPEKGIFDTATGSAKVRQPALPVDATASGATGGQLTSWRFQTIGDQFRIQVGYRNAINVLDMNFQGRLELDTDRSLLSGLVQTPFLINSSFNEIPSWGWDAAIQFQGGSGTASDPTPFYLDFGTQSLFVQPQRSYAFPYGFPFGESYNDGRWFVSGNRLVLEGSLSMLDARYWQLPGNGTVNVVRQPTRGQIIGRLFTNVNSQITDMIPKNKRAFDPAKKLLVPGIEWKPAQMISKTVPAGNVIKQWDLIKINADIANGNLVVRGTLARLEPSWRLWGGSVLLDTDVNSGTGKPFNNFLYKGETIGVDYSVSINTVDLMGYFGRTAYLVKPNGVKVGHDSWINFRYSNPNQVNSPASFITTIPLAAIGNPKGKVRLYVATFGNQIADIGPPQPLVIDLSQVK